MLLKAPEILNESGDVYVPSAETLQKLPCGIHRGTWKDVWVNYRHMMDVLFTAPVNLADYEIDIKVHMLMKGQYPCIPNWHCDNVPRNAEGKTEYGKVSEDIEHPMLLWLSGNPTTRFLKKDTEVRDFSNHGELHKIITDELSEDETFSVPSRTWLSMNQLTPHRGTVCEENTWRIFVRLTHKSIVTARPVISTVRRHCQVYLPHDFHW